MNGDDEGTTQSEEEACDAAAAAGAGGGEEARLGEVGIAAARERCGTSTRTKFCPNFASKGIASRMTTSLVRPIMILKKFVRIQDTRHKCLIVYTIGCFWFIKITTGWHLSMLWVKWLIDIFGMIAFHKVKMHALVLFSSPTVRSCECEKKVKIISVSSTSTTTQAL